MSDYETDALLGDEAKAELLAKRGQDGYDQLVRVLDDLAARRGEDEDATDMNGALMLALGDATLESLARDMLSKRLAADEALRVLLGAVAWEYADGVSKSELHRRTGLARTTIDRALA